MFLWDKGILGLLSGCSESVQNIMDETRLSSYSKALYAHH